LSPAIVALVLCAAVMHASWNALLKSGGDRLRAITLMSLASGAAALPVLPFVPLPAAAAWPALAVSAVVHVAYNLFLVLAYRHGDLGQVYPIARGSSPLLITLAAALIAGERPGPATLAGIVLISGGIASLSRGWAAAASRRGLLAALATGVLIAAYSVADGIGGRLSGAPHAYAAWLFVLDALPMPVIYWAVRGRRAPLIDRTPATWRGASGGVASLIAYALVIWAASVAPMGAVSALRETSVVFAALIGRVFLDERLSAGRLASCAAVAAGALLLGA
jgi:drug/metabolite transporter (DMT)-like permease